MIAYCDYLRTVLRLEQGWRSCTSHYLSKWKYIKYGKSFVYLSK